MIAKLKLFFFSKLSVRKMVFIFGILVVGAVGMLVVVHPIWAQTTTAAASSSTSTSDSGIFTGVLKWTMDSVGTLFSFIFSLVSGILGKLLSLVINIFIAIIQYNDFINAPAVVKGWSVVRDLCNMFFVVILLVIAFGTILRLPTYKYDRLLPKLVLMAVLINFSKAIAGFFIDLSQVVMLTFVNAFADNAAETFVVSFKMKALLDYSSQTNPPTGLEMFGVGLMACIFLIIALMVMLVFCVVFVVRIVFLWMLIVLSPLAYLLSILPGKAQSYASQWWQKFGQWVTIGPTLAFFLWLSLAVLSKTDAGGVPVTSTAQTAAIQSSATAIAASAKGFGISSVSDSANILGFIFSIAMLVMSLGFAGSLGGFAGKISGNMLGRVKKLGSAPLTGLKKAGGALAETKMSQNLLRGVAGSSIPGLNKLATRGLVAVATRAKAKDEKAAQYAASAAKFGGPKVRARIANQRTFGMPGRRRSKEAMEKLAPSSIRNSERLRKVMSGMTPEEAAAVKNTEIAPLGYRGEELVGELKTKVQRNLMANTAYNKGVRLRNQEEKRLARQQGRAPILTSKVAMTDEYGVDRVKNRQAVEARKRENDERASRGQAPLPEIDPIKVYGKPLSREETNRLFRQGSYKNSFKTAYAEDRDKAQGAGNISVGKFSQGTSNVAGVDFSKFSPELQQQLIKNAQIQTGDATITAAKHLKGVNTEDVGNMKKYGSEIAKIIGNEIKQLQASGGKDSRIQELQAARDRFSRGDMKDLSLVNTSSAGYHVADLTDSYVHERVHGAGLKEEDSAERLTKHLIDTHQISKLEGYSKDIASGRKTIDEVTGEDTGVVEQARIEKITKEIDELNDDVSQGRVMEKHGAKFGNNEEETQAFVKQQIAQKEAIIQQLEDEVDRKAIGGAPRPIEEVINKEVFDEADEEQERTKPQPATAKPDPNLQKILSSMAKASSLNTQAGVTETNYLLRQLVNTMGKQSQALKTVGKGLAGLGDINPDTTTPLEVSVIAGKIENMVNDSEHYNQSI
jgi:hypothetical protein